MEAEALWKSALVHYDRTGGTEYAWSFWCCPGKTADEIAADARFMNSTIRESTVGRMREAGFDPVPDSEDDDHCRVTLPGEPTGIDCKRLQDAFDEPRLNPGIEQ